MKLAAAAQTLTNALFFVVFAVVLLAPHILRGPLRTSFEEADSRRIRTWASAPLKELEPPEDRESVLDGRYARYLDEQVKETVFSRYLTAIGNELLYWGFETCRPPWVQGRDGWTFWKSSLEYVDGSYAPERLESGLERLVLIQELVTICFESRGIRCVFVSIPKKASVCSEFLPRGLEERRARGFTDPVWDMILERQANHGITTVDLRPRLREMQLDGALPFRKKDTHLSPFGITETARLVAKEIRRLDPQFVDRRGDPSTTVTSEKWRLVDAGASMGFRDVERFEDDFKVVLRQVNFPEARINRAEEAWIALAGTSFGERYGDRARGKANLARALAWELDTTVQDHAIRSGGPVKGLIEVVKETPSLPELKVVVSEYPFRHSFLRSWLELAKTLERTPWTKEALTRYFEANPEDRSRFKRLVKSAR